MEKAESVAHACCRHKTLPLRKRHFYKVEVVLNVALTGSTPVHIHK